MGIAAILANACGGSPIAGSEPLGVASEAIQGGYEDGSDLAVVGVALTDGDGNINRTCSGSLLAPNLVMTAQHCVASTSKFVECDDSAFGDPIAASQVIVTTDEQMFDDSTTWHAASELAIPPGAPAVCGRDVAMIVLSHLLTISPLTPRLDNQIQPDESYTAIGYGTTSEGANDDGVRRRRDNLSVECVATGCNTDHVVGDEWRGDHGICSGDSGGPAIDPSGYIIGVTSRGPLGCDDPIYGGLGLLAPWVVDVATHAAAVGGYPAPKWSGGPGGFAANDPMESEMSCSYSPAAEAGYASSVILLSLGVLSMLRRKREDADCD